MTPSKPDPLHRRSKLICGSCGHPWREHVEPYCQHYISGRENDSPGNRLCGCERKPPQATGAVLPPDEEIAHLKREVTLLRAENAEFRAECDKVGVPYDAAGLVRHHRNTAQFTADVDKWTLSRWQNRALKAEAVIEAVQAAVTMGGQTPHIRCKAVMEALGDHLMQGKSVPTPKDNGHRCARHSGPNPSNADSGPNECPDCNEYGTYAPEPERIPRAERARRWEGLTSGRLRQVENGHVWADPKAVFVWTDAEEEA